MADPEFSPSSQSRPATGKVPSAASTSLHQGRSDDTAVKETLATLFPSSIYELRVIGASDGRREGVFTGTFASDSSSSVLNSLGQLTHWKGAYVTLNRIRNEGARGQTGGLQCGARATGNADIDRIQWLLVDLDPVRPAGVSSTDVEHQAAIERAQAVRAFLVEEYGWPEPLLASSGNGAHLLFRADLAPESDLPKRLLAVLDGLFTDEQVGVDKSTFSPAQLTKLYGTRACKGTPTDERPHRVSRILESPDREALWANPVTEAQLRKFVEVHGEEANAPAPSATYESLASKSGLRWDSTNYGGGWSLARVEGLLSGAGIGVRQVKDMPYGKVLVLACCPMDDTHEVDLAASVTQLNSGALSASCKHNRCTWGWKDLRARFDPDYSTRASSPHSKATSPRLLLDSTPSPFAASELPRTQRAHRFFSLFEIMREDLPEYLVKGVLNKGELGVLYGAPASYKSFVALDLALRVTVGMVWHRERHRVRQGEVLYLAGEGTAGLTVRLRAWLQEWQGESAGWADDLEEDDVALDAFRCAHFSKEVPTLIETQEPLLFVQAVREHFRPESPPALIVIDTLARGFAGGDENHSGDMGRFLEACDHIRRETGAAILIIHHKGKEGDQERGSSALRAGVDVMIQAKASGNPANGVRVVTLTCDKCKDGATAEPLKLQMQVVEVGVDDEGDTVTSLVPEIYEEENDQSVEHPENAQPNSPRVVESDAQILAYLSTLDSGSAVSSKTIGEVTGVAKSTLHKRLNVLVKRGEIVCHGGSKPRGFSLPKRVVSLPSLTPKSEGNLRDLGVGGVAQQGSQSHFPPEGGSETDSETCSGERLDEHGETDREETL